MKKTISLQIVILKRCLTFFKENNFKINSMCEFILGYEKQNGE